MTIYPSPPYGIRMGTGGKPGPKPKRLYVRLVRFGDIDREELPRPRVTRDFLSNLERVARLIGHGELTEPKGDLLILRATDIREADRILRVDPFRGLAQSTYEILEWNAEEYGSGVNLEPPPALGAGRLTQLQRISIVVRDQGKSVVWYQEVLGFSVRRQDEETGYVEMSLGKGTAALSLVEPRPTWGEPYYSEALGRIGTATGIAFQTDSVRALELRLRNAGVRITQSSEVQPWGGRTIRFADTDGNEFLAFETGVPPGAGHSAVATTSDSE
ncbi:MAG: VOC family protein [Thermoplasmata archaeon]